MFYFIYKTLSLIITYNGSYVGFINNQLVDQDKQHKIAVIRKIKWCRISLNQVQLKKLSPWQIKRRPSKSVKNPNNKNLEQRKEGHSEKTQQFLRKIFTNRIDKRSQTNPISQLNQTKYKSAQKNKQQQPQEPSYIFLPINLLNFKKSIEKKQIQVPKTTKKPELNKTFMHTVQPKMDLKLQQHYSHRANQAPKASPMVLTFRRSWRKRQKCKTQPSQNISQNRNITISQLYNLLGKKPVKKHSFSFNSNVFENTIAQQISQQQVKDTQWLVPRQFINRKNKRIRTIPAKTQGF